VGHKTPAIRLEPYQGNPMSSALKLKLDRVYRTFLPEAPEWPAFEVGNGMTGNELLEKVNTLRRAARKKAKELRGKEFSYDYINIEKNRKIYARDALIDVFDISENRTIKEIPKEALIKALREGVEGKEQMKYFLMKDFSQLSEELFLKMSILPPEFITAIVMTAGYGFGKEIYPYFNKIFKSEKVVYPQYSSGLYSHKWFSDQHEMKRKAYLLEEDIVTLQKNPSTPIVLVDHVCDKGITFGTLMNVVNTQLDHTGDFFVIAARERMVMTSAEFLKAKNVMSDPEYAEDIYNTPIVTEYGNVLVDGELVEATNKVFEKLARRSAR
jgi:hypothetical protein